MELDVHPADPEERLEAYRNVHEAWGGGAPLEEFVAARLASVQHRRATWWVGTLDGEVVTSLGCYPLAVDPGDGAPRRAFGLGAVHTRPAARGRGHAAVLCRRVIEDCRSKGALYGLLFSEIGTAYYERMGFRALPALRYRCDDLEGLAASGPRALLVEVEPLAALTRLAALYAAAHRGTLHLARDGESWRHTLARHPEGVFELVVMAGEPRGYFRRLDVEEGCVLLELALAGDAASAPAWRALAAAALERGRRWLGCWTAPPAELAARFEILSRQEITMLAAFPPAPEPDAQALAAARIHPADHF